MKRTPREAAERIISEFQSGLIKQNVAYYPPEDSPESAVILAVSYLADCAANDTLRAIVERLPHTADGVPVICDGMTVYCPRGHATTLQYATHHVYCCDGECWNSGCQGDSGGGTSYLFCECRARKTE